MMRMVALTMTTRQKKNSTDIILRDVEKAFDKVWHTGLKYKILQKELHTCFTRTLCDYLTDKTVTIQIETTYDPLSH